VSDTSNTHIPEQIKYLFRKLRLGAPAWIDMPLEGITEAADIAEECVGQYPELFWNTPLRLDIHVTRLI
jgi:hypothetical protein